MPRSPMMAHAIEPSSLAPPSARVTPNVAHRWYSNDIVGTATTSLRSNRSGSGSRVPGDCAILHRHQPLHSAERAAPKEVTRHGSGSTPSGHERAEANE